MFYMYTDVSGSIAFSLICMKAKGISNVLLDPAKPSQKFHLQMLYMYADISGSIASSLICMKPIWYNKFYFWFCFLYSWIYHMDVWKHVCWLKMF